MDVVDADVNVVEGWEGVDDVCSRAGWEGGRRSDAHPK